MQTRKILGQSVQYLLHLLFPRTCFACGCDLSAQENGPLCPLCTHQLKKPGPYICKRCGVVLKSGGAYCYACRGSKAKKYTCKMIRSAFIFNTSSRALVHGLKYKQADYLAAFIGESMFKQFAQYPELAEVNLIVPVPLHPRKLRKRGYNQSELLARSFSLQLGLESNAACLIRTRDTASQTKLNRQGRLANMSDAFACIAPGVVKGKTILLIDDVATTGATLEGCARALRQAGAKKVLAYTFARE